MGMMNGVAFQKWPKIVDINSSITLVIRPLSCFGPKPNNFYAITGDLELDPDGTTNDPDVTANLVALRKEFDQTVFNLQYYEVS